MILKNRSISYDLSFKFSFINIIIKLFINKIVRELIFCKFKLLIFFDT